MDSKQYKKKNKRQAKRKAAEKNKFYYAFVVALVVIILAVIFISNGFSFDFSDSSPDGNVGTSEKVDEIRDLVVTFIDVGQGDCVWINLPDGKNMLIDAGENSSARNAIDSFLIDGSKKASIDYCIATHPDSDHIGNMSYVYENYEVGRSYRPYLISEHALANDLPSTFNYGIKLSEKSSTKVYGSYVKSVYDEGTEWEFFTDRSDFTNSAEDKNGATYSYTVDFMMPYARDASDFSSVKSANNLSAIVMLEYAGRKVLFTGDVEKSVEASFVELAAKEAADCDVLKVAHHGSKTSSTLDFLRLVKPEYAVISCGVGNKYSHPEKETVDRLIALNSEIYRTDIQGSISLRIKADGSMSFEKSFTEFDDEMIFFSGKEIAENEDRIKAAKEAA